MRFLRTQWFSAVMVGLFAAAWAAPGLSKAINPGRWTETAAIALIFLVSGLSLRTEDAVRALGAWRLHLFIQVFNLVLMPAVAWCVIRPLAGHIPEGLVVGLYLLAVVPTTVTSCVVFTQLAGGNTAGALFNAVAGNLLGIVVSPALLRLMLGVMQMKIEVNGWHVFLKLCAIVLLPFVVGQLFHRRLAGRSAFKQYAANINRFCILLIIYLAFGALFARGAANLPPWHSIVVPLLLLPPVHLLLLWASYNGARAAGFPLADRITVLFCAPQKTLSLGLPMAVAVLAKRPELIGLASLPILVYHPVQLITAGILEQRFRAAARR